MGDSVRQRTDDIDARERDHFLRHGAHLQPIRSHEASHRSALQVIERVAGRHVREVRGKILAPCQRDVLFGIARVDILRIGESLFTDFQVAESQVGKAGRVIQLLADG